jgi:hypothetical protein
MTRIGMPAVIAAALVSVLGAVGPASSFAQAAPPAPSTAPSAAATGAPAVPAPPAPAAADTSAKARFSDTPTYAGPPNLPVTLSMVIAGGGPTAFDATKLVGVLAGDKTQAEVANLQQKFGADGVKSFLNVFTFVVNQSLAYVNAAKVQLPSQPGPDPKDGKALAAALYKMGVTPAGRFDVEYMLDGLVTHDIHVKVMDDIDAKFGLAADSNYHAVLTQAMLDLKEAYGL